MPIISVAVLTWLAAPIPEGLTPPAWHLFLIFISTIAIVIANAMPIFVAAIGALAISLLTRVLTPAQAFSGFSKDFILLIAVAFLIARGVVKSGLGNRIAYLIIEWLGRTTLGLGYSMVATDLLIAPAFPSNTARSGVLFPIVQSLALGTGSAPDEATRKTTGAFLMHPLLGPEDLDPQREPGFEGLAGQGRAGKSRNDHPPRGVSPS